MHSNESPQMVYGASLANAKAQGLFGASVSFKRTATDALG